MSINPKQEKEVMTTPMLPTMENLDAKIKSAEQATKYPPEAALSSTKQKTGT
jgi:hypothetical protein